MPRAAFVAALATRRFSDQKDSAIADMRARASSNGTAGGGSRPSSRAASTPTDALFCAAFQLCHADHKAPLADYHYGLVSSDGSRHTGTTDASGITARFRTDTAGSVSLAYAIQVRIGVDA